MLLKTTIFAIRETGFLVKATRFAIREAGLFGIVISFATQEAGLLAKTRGAGLLVNSMLFAIW